MSAQFVTNLCTIDARITKKGVALSVITLCDGILDPIGKSLLICGVPRSGRSGSQLAVEVGDDGPVACIHLAVVVRHDLLVVLIYLPVVRIHTALVLSVYSVDLALQLSLSLALRRTHLPVELSYVESSCHQMGPPVRFTATRTEDLAG